MKKILYSVIALTMAAFTLTGCEDVPAPYDTPENNGDDTPSLPEGVFMDQNFTSSLGDFNSVATSGELAWYNDFSSAMITGYQDFDGDGKKENKAGVTYLVSKELDLSNTENAHLTITHAINYERGDINQNNAILISKDYNGNVETATWEALIYNTDGLGSSFTFTEKEVNIPASYVGGKAVIALRHTCSASQSSTWEVKSIKVSAGEAEGQPDNPDAGDVLKPVNGTYINEAFNGSFGVFSVQNVNGTPWVLDSYGYAKATGYDNASKTTTPSESYLVSKPMDMTTSKSATISFQYILRYVTTSAGEPIAGISNKVLVTDNYTGDAATTKWTDITGTLTEVRDWKTWTTFTAAIPQDMVGKENIVVALYYTCDSSSGTWEVKELTVKDGEGSGDAGDEGDVKAPNGDFETWVDGKPNNWATASTAGNATLSQSTDAHGGKYSVQVGGTTSANKRIGYKEMELKAGKYTMTFYTKAATATGASVRPGFVQVTDGKVGNYNYGEYTNDIPNTEWVKVTHEFTVDADGTYCLVIMNAKKPGADVLIDDFTLESNGTMIIK